MKNFASSLIFILMLLSGFCVAQKHDTLAVVQVISSKPNTAVLNASPLQLLNTTDAYKTNSISVADAVKHLAGVIVKDYGGIGGLKTIDVRSLGATHTGLLYDGIAVSSAQAGVIDFGKFSLDNIQQIALQNSGPSDVLSTARAFSYSSLLVLKTTSDADNGFSENRLNVKLQKGSFGYISPSVFVQKKFSNNFMTAVSATYQTAESDYPFTSYENSRNKQTRTNSDVKSFRIETDLAWHLKGDDKFNFKSYIYDSKRGLPGAIILYSTTGNQRLNDREIFLQATWKSKLSKRNELLISTKYQNDKTFYLDPSYPNNLGRLENEFHQEEVYLSTVLAHKITHQLTVSFSSDVFSNSLTRTDIFAKDFPEPKRLSSLNNAAFHFTRKRIEITGNLLFTHIKEKVRIGLQAKEINAFSESVALSFQPFKKLPLRGRLFYKHVFRVPTFNELYYTNFGNTNLRPEYADQYNAGLTYEKNDIHFIDKLSVTSDAYYNQIKDKILAVPRANLFQWSAQNIGKTAIKGLDVAIHLQLKEWRKLVVRTDIAYTFQQAQDVTNRTSALYKSQIPYTPKHSGSSTLGIQYKNASLNYNVLFSSYRYRPGDPIFENLLQPWSSSDLSFSYSFRENYSANYKIIFEMNNIFNEQYEIIRYYPMPLNNYRLTIQFSLKNKNKSI
ncbi:MAG: TonB-dependent receptor plug domain-containing protein [Ferruginibacter sp.]